MVITEVDIRVGMVIRDAFVVYTRDGHRHYQCDGRKCKPDMDEAPKTYFSTKEAIEDGWQYIDYFFWLCPECRMGK